MDYKVETLGNTTFVLRPEYDALVIERGSEPPLGLPVECTFEWAWDLAEQTVAKQNRIAAAKARATARKEAVSEQAAKPVRKAPVRKASRAKVK